MGWRELCHFGETNLKNTGERLQAFDEAERYLNLMGLDASTINEILDHEKAHLFAFPDFEEGSGKKLGLVLEIDPDEGFRLAVKPNRRHLRADIRRSLRAAEDPSEGDLNYGCINRFRRR